jgi:hypothetical protein
MKRNTILVGTLLLLAAGTGMAQSAPPSAEPAVTQIIVLDVGPNTTAAVPKLIDIMKRADTIAQKIGNRGKARLWALTFAGDNSGKFVIAVESPNLGAMAADSAKMRATPEWQKLIADVDESGFKVVSQSLAMEVPIR